MNFNFSAIRSCLIFLVLVPSIATASDGRFEINQTCAEGPGCFSGDPAGFPVSITQPGSYVLTGPLTVPADKDGIVVNASRVSIDLNGYTILRSGFVCLQGNCTWDNAGSEGITSISGVTGNQVTVRNGTLFGFPNHCIKLGNQANISDLQVLHCGGDGIGVREGSVVQNNSVTNTGLAGIRLGDGSVYAHNTAVLAGLDDFQQYPIMGGSPTGGNYCQSNYVTCDPLHRPLYYLTNQSVQGNGPLTHCADGFHMASIWEIVDISTLRYDHRRGVTTPDSGLGPPVGEFEMGWVRTGGEWIDEFQGGGENNAGIVNCNGWNDDSGELRGTLVGLPERNWTTSASQWIAPWEAATATCSSANRVWCVQD